MCLYILWKWKHPSYHLKSETEHLPNHQKTSIPTAFVFSTSFFVFQMEKILAMYLVYVDAEVWMTVVKKYKNIIRKQVALYARKIYVITALNNYLSLKHGYSLLAWSIKYHIPNTDFWNENKTNSRKYSICVINTSKKIPCNHLWCRVGVNRNLQRCTYYIGSAGTICFSPLGTWKIAII